uniref:Ixodegrin B n=1 Tax=Rhipicephalus zambeziensis TaxID=60191 RepID=A0A224YGK2_9ACAR
MRGLLIISVFLGCYVIAYTNDDDDDLLQKPMDIGLHGPNSDGHRKTRRYPRGRGRYGAHCINSDDCNARYCCLMYRGIRTCQPRAHPGRLCTEFQYKGGYYRSYCPCLYGEGQCKRSVCSRTPWWE